MSGHRWIEQQHRRNPRSKRRGVSKSGLDELIADKYLLSLGLQTRRGPWFYRFALTENLKNFSNTPDVGLTFSLARVMFGD